MTENETQNHARTKDRTRDRGFECACPYRQTTEKTTLNGDSVVMNAYKRNKTFETNLFRSTKTI